MRRGDVGLIADDRRAFYLGGFDVSRSDGRDTHGRGGRRAYRTSETPHLDPRTAAQRRTLVYSRHASHETACDAGEHRYNRLRQRADTGEPGLLPVTVAADETTGPEIRVPRAATGRQRGVWTPCRVIRMFVALIYRGSDCASMPF